MNRFLPQPLIRLARLLNAPLYVVGGSVRDFLSGYPLGEDADWDLASPADGDTVLAAARAAGMRATAVYPATGTVKLQDGDGRAYEFTRFRTDTYRRGMHAPAAVSFTDDIEADARRRDLSANAVYYSIPEGRFLDPTGGMDDIRNGTLRTVAPAEKVFGEDGLRLLRLARIAAETGFAPDDEAVAGARANADLVRDIAPERVFRELDLLLHADLRHGDGDAPYRGLCLLRETGVLARVLPELALGDGMAQRPDFHAHDVLEHSFRCVRYSPPSVRFAALLHDVGKPFCFLRDGNFHAHPAEGERIARDILSRLRAPKRLEEETAVLVREHMRDLDCRMRETKLRRELVRLSPVLPALLALKQADYSASKDDLSPAPTVVRWEGLLRTMREEGAPLCLADLAIKGEDLLALGARGEQVGHVLHELLLFCAENGARNERSALLRRAAALLSKENP